MTIYPNRNCNAALRRYSKTSEQRAHWGQYKFNCYALLSSSQRKSIVWDLEKGLLSGGSTIGGLLVYCINAQHCGRLCELGTTTNLKLQTATFFIYACLNKGPNVVYGLYTTYKLETAWRLPWMNIWIGSTYYESQTAMNKTHDAVPHPSLHDKGGVESASRECNVRSS